jgi:hypothetical protein
MVYLIQDLKLSYETMLAEVPIVLKNSFLMNVGFKNGLLYSFSDPGPEAKL